MSSSVLRNFHVAMVVRLSYWSFLFSRISLLCVKMGFDIGCHALGEFGSLFFDCWDAEFFSELEICDVLCDVSGNTDHLVECALLFELLGRGGKEYDGLDYIKFVCQRACSFC